MKLSVLHRKFVSLAVKTIRSLRNYYYYAKMRLLGINVRLGKKVTFGRMVQVVATDGGEIIIGDGVAIQDFAMLCASRGTLEIGDNTLIGTGSQLATVDSVKIGNDCLIAAYSVIRDANHGMERGIPMSQQACVNSPIVIGDDVWLGTHVVVTAGVTIGAGTVIGANAVVTREMPDFSVAVGVPARIIKTR